MIIMTSPYLSQKFSPFQKRICANKEALGVAFSELSQGCRRGEFVVQICHRPCFTRGEMWFKISF